MRRVLTAVAAVALALASGAAADEELRSESGSLWTRPTLSGDWGGLRSRLAEHGVTFDLSVTQIAQGIVSGGKDTGWASGGRGDLVVDVDTRKLGLWHGGHLALETEGNWGSDVNSQTGAHMAVNSSQTYPFPNAHGVYVSQLMLTQFFSRTLGVAVGKVQTGSDANAFAAGKGDDRFYSLAFSFNAAATLTIPYTALGAGLIYLPTGDEETAELKLFVVDSDGTAKSSGFDTVFNGNTTYNAEGRVRTALFGLAGHQLIGGAYSTKAFTSLAQNVRLVIEDRSLQQKNGSWCVYWNFDQYLFEATKGSGHGIGVFGRFGASDGNPNPVKYVYSVGIGGDGIVPGRPRDGFGIGYYYITVGHPTFTGPFRSVSFLGDEQGAEAYYNVAVTPWMKVTPDVQVVRPAQRRTLASSGGGGAPRPIDTATVLGFRLQLVL